MLLGDWLSGALPPEVAVYRGMHENAFLREVLETSERKLRFLCDNKLGQKIAMVANDVFRNQPVLLASKQLDRDLMDTLSDPDDRMLVVPFTAIGKYVLNQTERLGRAVDLTAGYEMPEQQMAALVIGGLREVVERVALLGNCPVLLHDADGGYLLNLGPDVVLLGDQSGEDVVAQLTQGPMAAATEGGVRAHVRFLVQTELPELRRLHDFSAPKSVKLSIMNFWKGNVSDLMEQTEDRDLWLDCQEAIEKINKSFA